MNIEEVPIDGGYDNNAAVMQVGKASLRILPLLHSVMAVAALPRFLTLTHDMCIASFQTPKMAFAFGTHMDTDY